MCHPEHSEGSLIETHYEILRVALNDTYKKTERGAPSLRLHIYYLLLTHYLLAINDVDGVGLHLGHFATIELVDLAALGFYCGSLNASSK